MLIEVIVGVSIAALVGVCMFVALTHEPRRRPIHRVLERMVKTRSSRRPHDN